MKATTINAVLTMKTTTIGAVLTVSLLWTGCGKQAGTSSSASPAATPVAQPSMTAWQQGDPSTAIRSFVETDWSGRPLFAPGSTLSLTEDQFKSRSNADRQRKSQEMISQLDSLKKLAAAVAQAGRDAAAKGDTAQARKCFTALKQSGTALDSPDRLRLVQPFLQRPPILLKHFASFFAGAQPPPQIQPDRPAPSNLPSALGTFVGWLPGGPQFGQEPNLHPRSV
jgi:hypothetical protein